MTPQQAAEKKYPYKESEYGTLTDKLREAYISGLQDAPQLSRSLLEEVRVRCAEACWSTIDINRVLSVNLDDLLPVGYGWIDESIEPTHPNAVWALLNTLGRQIFIPAICYYSNGKNIEVFDAHENQSLLAKGWYTLEEQDHGDFEEIYKEASVAYYKNIDWNNLPTPPQTVNDREV